MTDRGDVGYRHGDGAGNVKTASSNSASGDAAEYKAHADHHRRPLSSRLTRSIESGYPVSECSTLLSVRECYRWWKRRPVER